MPLTKLLSLLRIKDTASVRQCVETIQEEPKLKCYQIGGAETTLIIVAIRRDNYLQDFNMVKTESRLQTYMQPIIVGAIKPN